MLERQEIILEHELLLERWSGVATIEEVRQALRGHVENPDFDKVRFILSDERRIEDFAISALEIREFAMTAKKSMQAYEGKRWAFVVDAARTTALVMLFQSLLDSEIEVQVFATMESALVWLGVAPETIDYVLREIDDPV